MLKCRDITEQTSRFIDKELPWQQKVSWYVHFAICSSCRKFVRHFDASVALAKRIGRRTAPADDAQVKAVNEQIDKHLHS